MKERQFLVVMGALTLFFTALTVVYNLASIPSSPGGGQAAPALTVLFASGPASGSASAPVSGAAGGARPGNSVSDSAAPSAPSPAGNAASAGGAASSRAPSRKASSSNRPASGSPASAVNINTAGLSELVSLPGVGDVLAGRIVAYRQQNGPFQTVDELDKVKGIGEKLLARIRPYATVG